MLLCGDKSFTTFDNLSRPLSSSFLNLTLFGTSLVFSLDFPFGFLS